MLNPTDHDDDVGLLGGERAGAPYVGAVAHCQEEHDPLQLDISTAGAGLHVELVQDHG